MKCDFGDMHINFIKYNSKYDSIDKKINFTIFKEISMKKNE